VSRYRSSDDGAKILLAVIFLAIVITCAVWFHMNYRCTSTHFEYRTECTVHRDGKGRRTGETCHEHRVDVCDAWEER
jgi:hypothetical protein